MPVTDQPTQFYCQACDREWNVGYETATWHAIREIARMLITVAGDEWRIGDDGGGGVFQAVYRAAREADLYVGGTYAGPRDEGDDGRRNRRPPTTAELERLRVTYTVRTRIMERDGYECRKCGQKKTLRVDHVRPLADGGNSDDDNLQTLCKPCHATKTKQEAAARRTA